MSEETVPAIDLSDAREWLDRAKGLGRELEQTLHEEGGLWQLREAFDRTAGLWSYSVILDSSKLKVAKWIIADAASSISSALDHIAAAIARAKRSERHKGLYFPFGFADEAFQAALKKYEPVLGTEMSNVLAQARQKYRHEVHHVEAAKQIANSGKHWEVLLPSGAMHAVALNTAHGQRIFGIPKDAFKEADEYEFHKDKERLPHVPLQTLVGVIVEGLTDGLPKSPETILTCAFRFVTGMIDEVEKAACNGKR